MKAACWLMDRFGVAEPLVGDLVERSRHQTPIWLWRQALAAMVKSVLTDVRAHPVLALRAVIMGRLLGKAHIVVSTWLWHRINPVLGTLTLAIALRSYGGFIVSTAYALITVPDFVAIGWLIARFHRARLAVLYVLAIWCAAMPEMWRIGANGIDQPRFRPYLVTYVAGLCWFTISVVVGALWRKDQPHEIA